MCIRDRLIVAENTDPVSRITETKGRRITPLHNTEKHTCNQFVQVKMSTLDSNHCRLYIKQMLNVKYFSVAY